MTKHLNTHLAAEMYSADFYFGLASDFARAGLMGFAHWLTQQWREENGHALRFAEFIVSRGGGVVLEPIPAASVEWENPVDAMRQALKHEQLITSRINALVTQARAETDYACETFLLKFVEEQVEEEAQLNALIGKLAMVGDDPAGLVHCDRIMMQRPRSSG
jgi:ferritin